MSLLNSGVLNNIRKAIERFVYKITYPAEYGTYYSIADWTTTLNGEGSYDSVDESDYIDSNGYIDVTDCDFIRFIGHAYSGLNWRRIEVKGITNIGRVGETYEFREGSPNIYLFGKQLIDHIPIYLKSLQSEQLEVLIDVREFSKIRLFVENSVHSPNYYYYTFSKFNGELTAVTSETLETSVPSQYVRDSLRELLVDEYGLVQAGIAPLLNVRRDTDITGVDKLKLSKGITVRVTNSDTFKITTNSGILDFTKNEGIIDMAYAFWNLSVDQLNFPITVKSIKSEYNYTPIKEIIADWQNCLYFTNLEIIGSTDGKSQLNEDKIYDILTGVKKLQEKRGTSIAVILDFTGNENNTYIFYNLSSLVAEVTALNVTITY